MAENLLPRRNRSVAVQQTSPLFPRPVPASTCQAGDTAGGVTEVTGLSGSSRSGVHRARQEIHLGRSGGSTVPAGLASARDKREYRALRGSH